jgi:hypothetical protein
MGDVPLRQTVEASWTLGGLFVEMYFKSILPAPDGQRPYEAVYYIGYNEQENVYVLHLLDTFGVGTGCVVGLGQRTGSSIPFVFNYAEGPFTNTLSWEPVNRAWTFEQTYLENDQVKTFATKRMSRRTAAAPSS